MPGEQRSRIPNALFAVALGALCLYGGEGYVVDLGVLGWLAVASAGVAGAWIGWLAARQDLRPGVEPAKSNQAAIVFGIAVALSAGRLFSAEAQILILPVGSLILMIGIGYFGHRVLPGEHVKR